MQWEVLPDCFWGVCLSACFWVSSLCHPVSARFSPMRLLSIHPHLLGEMLPDPEEEMLLVPKRDTLGIPKRTCCWIPARLTLV